MSIQIPLSFAIKFRDDFIILSQQKESRLENTVRDDPDSLEGKYGYWERIGATEMQEVLDRHGDTKLVNTPHSRRRIALRDWDWADLIDKADMRRIRASGMLPAKYAQNARMAAGRKKDDLIIAAARGNAFSIDANDAATAVPLPAAQKVAVAATGLTLAKLIKAREIIDASEVDPDEPRTAVVTSKQISDLLNTTEVKSSDFNTVKALHEGRVNEFMGFTFKRTERLPKVGSDRFCLFYAKSGIGLAKAPLDGIETDIGPRRDKRNSTQVYLAMGFDATRVEDEKVVEVACLET